MNGDNATIRQFLREAEDKGRLGEQVRIIDAAKAVEAEGIAAFRDPRRLGGPDHVGLAIAEVKAEDRLGWLAVAIARVTRDWESES